MRSAESSSRAPGSSSRRPRPLPAGSPTQPGVAATIRLGATTMVAVALLAQAGTASADSSGPGGLAACRALADDGARLKCYDTLADHTLTTVGVPAPQPAPEYFGRPPDEARRVVEEQLGQADHLAARVVGCRKDRGGKLAFQLDNGQRWTQIDTTTAQCRVGATVDIERAALGSYLLHYASGSPAGGPGLRVRRTD